VYNFIQHQRGQHLDAANQDASNGHILQKTPLNPLLPARDYLPDHHVHMNYFQIITSTYADVPYRAAARIELRTCGTLRASRSTAHGAQVT